MFLFILIRHWHRPPMSPLRTESARHVQYARPRRERYTCMPLFELRAVSAWGEGNAQLLSRVLLGKMRPNSRNAPVPMK
jgi:hypothetical protein